MPKSMHGVMSEFKDKKLHSGSKTGPVVKDHKQAVAIGLNEKKELSGKLSKWISSRK